MAITTSWADDNQTIIVLEFKAPWTWNEYYQALDDTWRMFEQVAYTVDMVFDFTRGSRLPPGAFGHLRRSTARQHPRTGIVVVVGINAFFEVIGIVMNRLFPEKARKVRAANDRETAYQIIADVRQTRQEPV